MSSRAVIPLLAGCVIFGAAILFELGPAGSEAPIIAAAEPRAQATPRKPVQPPPTEELVATAVARPLFSPTRRPAERASPTTASDSDISDIRLTGIVMQPDRHLAIFAVAGAKPVVRAEGESLKEWRLESISPTEVSLSGPGGSRTLAPRTDPNLVRPGPPAFPGPAAAGRAAQPGAAQPAPGAGRPPNAQVQPGALLSGPQAAPTAMLQPRPMPVPNPLAARPSNPVPIPPRPPGTRPQQ